MEYLRKAFVNKLISCPDGRQADTVSDHPCNGKLACIRWVLVTLTSVWLTKLSLLHVIILIFSSSLELCRFIRYVDLL